MKRATLLRTCMVLQAAWLVIAVTWAQFSPYDLAGDLAAQEAAAKGQAPAPGAEAAFRRLITAPPPQSGTDVTKLGPVQSIGYLGSFSESPIPGLARRIDNFRVTYRNGTLLWRVGLDKQGKPDTVSYDSPEPLTPRQTISRFSHFPPTRFWFLTASRIAILVVLAVVGRYVLRIRL